jgi:hypothetical protein
VRHFININYNKWYGLAATPDAELHRADRMADEIQPFTLLTGSKTFGNWVQILGSSDTPLVAGMKLFNINEFLVTVTDSTTAFIMQLVSGESADIAAKIAAEKFDEFPYIAATVANDSGIIELKRLKIEAGTKVWCRACCMNESAKSISFYFGLQEFDI